MKIFRPLAAALLVFALGHVAPAQESGEIASLRAKAEKGNGIAQYNLGLAYAQGRGVAADPVEAYVWLSLARENGARGRALDNVIGTLDKPALELAQQRLTERKAALGGRPAVAPAPAAAKPAAGPTGSDTTEDPALARLRKERDAYSAKVGEIAADLFTVRTERDHLAEQAAEIQKNTQAVNATNLSLQEKARAAEARAAELERTGEALKTELARTQQELAALAAKPKPAPDTAALEAQARELAAALTELEAAKNFGRQVEDTLNKVNDDRARVAASAAAELEAARQFGQQVEATLNRVNDQKAAFESQLAVVTQAKTAAEQALAAKPGAPGYPDLTGRVRELETALAAAQNATPAYPNLTDRVRELETQRSSDLSAVASAKAEAARAKQEIAALTQAKEAAQNAKPAAPAYPDLTGRVGELETQLAKTNTDLSAVGSAKADLSVRVAELETKLATAEKSAAEKPATPAYPNLTGKVAELEAALAAARKTAPAYPDLRSRVTELETRFADLQAAAQEHTQELARANTKLAGDETSFAALSSEANRAKQEILALTKAKEDVGRELADAKNSLARANQALAAKPAAPNYPDLSGRVAELETALATLSADATRAKQEIAALTQAKEDVRTAAPAYPNLTGKVAELEGQIASLQSAAAAVTQMKSHLAEREAQVLQLAQEVKRGETGLQQAQESYTALEAEANQLRQRPVAPAYPDLSGRVAELEAALATKPAAPTYPDLSGRVGELETALADASRQLVALGSDATRAKQEIAALTQAKEAAQNAKPAAPAYPDLSGRVTELEEAVATSIQKFDAAEQGRVELARQFDDYKSATAAAQRERTTLQSNLKMLESDKAALRRQVDAATTEANQLRTQVAALKTQAAAPKNTAPAYPDLSGRVSELESQLAKANTDLSAAGSAKADLSGRVRELETALATKPAVPAYPDLSDRVGELEATLAATKQRLAAQPVTPGYPDLSGRVAELESALAAKPAAPTYPDLSGRVSELETALAAARQQPAAPNYPDLSGRVSELEAALVTARNAAPAHPDLSGRVGELESQLAKANTDLSAAGSVKADLSGRVAELGSEVTQLRSDRERMQKLLADSGRQLRDNTADTARIKELEAQLAARAAESSQTKQEMLALAQAKENAQAQLAAASAAAPAYPDLSGRVRELEAQIAAAPRSQTTTPAYPDLSGRVSELESALAATKQQLAAAQTAPATAAAGDTPGLQQKLADSEDRLATALRGYATLQRERDALAETAAKSAAAVTAERDSLAGQVASLTGQVEQLRASAQSSTGSTQAELARLNEAVAALQRTSTQAFRDAAAARALAQQLQGANAVLAGENYQLKTMLARSTGGPVPAIAPVTAPAVRTHVVAAGDSLSRLSQRYYGTAGRWQEIYNANAVLLGPNGVLRVGTELRIP